jgi:hypothetical protein
MNHMDQASLDAEQQREARDLHRGLKDRHVQLIALGARSALACSSALAGRSPKPAPASSSPMPSAAS